MSVGKSAFTKKFITLTLAAGVLFSLLAPVYAAQIALTWDAVDPAPEGYRVYQRSESGTYDYSAPVWAGADAKCTVDNLAEGGTYAFVVRAYLGTLESGDSNEVTYYVAPPPAPSSSPSSDGTSGQTDSTGALSGSIPEGSQPADDYNYGGTTTSGDLPELALIPQSQMTVISVDSEELDGSNGSADNAIDGRADTMWHTEWYYSDPTPPHEIVIDLGGYYNVRGFRYLPRQDSCENGTVAEYAFYVSQDGQTWQTPVAKGAFTGGRSEKEQLFQGKYGRYVRFEALSEVNALPWTSVAEFNVLGDEVALIPQSRMTVFAVDSEELNRGNYSADNAIDGDKDTLWHTEWYYSDPTPPHELIIDLGGLYNVQGFRYLPRQDSVANGTVAEYAFYVSMDGVTWQAPAATGVFTASLSEKEALFQGQLGRYVRFEALSEVNGKPWTCAAEFNVIGHEVAIDEMALIPQSQMTVLAVDSEELDRGDYSAYNAIDGRKDTLWHTEWYYSDPKPPHELIIDLGALYNVQGFRYLPRQDSVANGTVSKYAFYVSLDGVTWQAPAATGLFTADRSEKEALFQGQFGRYVRFEALSEVNGKPWTCAAEFNVLGALIAR